MKRRQATTQRYKLYKSGKQWLVMGLAVMAFGLGGQAMTTTAHAEVASATIPTEQIRPVTDTTKATQGTDVTTDPAPSQEVAATEATTGSQAAQPKHEDTEQVPQQLPATAVPVKPTSSEVIRSGQNGEAKWEVTKDKTLIIHAGQLANTGDNHPWTVINDQVGPLTAVKIEPGVKGAPTMKGFFSGLQSVKEIQGLPNLDTSRTRDFSQFFYYMKALKKLDLSHFDMTNATTVSQMLDQMTALTQINLGNQVQLTKVAGLDANNGAYDGRWQAVGAGTLKAPSGNIYSVVDLMTAFDQIGGPADTYVKLGTDGGSLADDETPGSAGNEGTTPDQDGSDASSNQDHQTPGDQNPGNETGDHQTPGDPRPGDDHNQHHDQGTQTPNTGVTDHQTPTTGQHPAGTGQPASQRPTVTHPAGRPTALREDHTDRSDGAATTDTHETTGTSTTKQTPVSVAASGIKPQGHQQKATVKAATAARQTTLPQTDETPMSFWALSMAALLSGIAGSWLLLKRH